jgi:hypothetical protein
VPSPCGPADLPVVSDSLHWHHWQRHEPPVQVRRCEVWPAMSSKSWPQPLSQMYLPLASRVTGPVAPPRKREPHAEQSCRTRPS